MTDVFYIHTRACACIYLRKDLSHLSHVKTGIGDKNKKLLENSSSFLCSATGNRTPVYGVRGRRPRPLDDSTVTLSYFLFESECKGTTKNAHTQIFLKKSAKKMHFLCFLAFFEQKKKRMGCILRP